MLGSFGLWSSSKGMKIISNLIGLNHSAAEAQVVTDGFSLGTVTASPSSDAAEQANDNKVISQNPSAGTLAQYESNIDLTYRTFSFTPFSVFSFVPFNVFSFTPFSVFTFTPFSVFTFTPFSVFGFR